ncbi:MAG: BamA/TamA family outer membrane protein, partial [Acidobacteria bacterium]|nr:BamA/TamA family outer membrane protein [Acidobacteriota bacterium]
AWLPVGSDVDSAEEAPVPANSQQSATSVVDAEYSPLATLAPRYWLPVIEADDRELSVGAATSGFDALGRHAYGATLSFTLRRERPDWQLAYAYDRWRPTLFVSVADDTDLFRDAEVRTREVNGGALFPIKRVRWAQNLLMAFNASRDTVRCDTGCEEGIVPSTATRRSLRFGWTYDSAKTYGYSVSAERGIRLRVTGELTREAFGSDDNAGAVTGDARIYRRAWPRHGAIAARLAGATSWGDSAARRVFSASGPGPQDLDFDFGVNAIGLLRGFASDAVVGRHAALANLDYRFPLRYVERGVGTVPFFLRSAHAAVFADAGHAWSRDFVRSQSRVSAGAELSLDIVVAYWLPLTFTTGAAWRHDGNTDRRGIVAFGRIGRAF